MPLCHKKSTTSLAPAMKSWSALACSTASGGRAQAIPGAERALRLVRPSSMSAADRDMHRSISQRSLVLRVKLLHSNAQLVSSPRSKQPPLHAILQISKHTRSISIRIHSHSSEPMLHGCAGYLHS